KELLVEPADVCQDRPGDPKTGAGQYRCGMRPVLRQIAHIIRREPAAFGKQRRQTGQTAKGYPWTGKSPARFRQKTTASIHHPDPEPPDAGSPFEKGKAMAGEVLGDHGIGIEKKDILTVRQLQCLVIRPCKSDILVIDNPPYGREQRPQRFRTSVGGMVVDYNGLRFYSHQGLLQRVKTQLQKISYPVVHNNDG